MRIFLFSFVILLLAVTSVQLLMTRDTPVSEKVVDETIGQSEVQIGGAFTLTDQHGNSVQESAFRGKVMLVFFGFTHCPEICPVTVSTLTKTMALLGDKADEVVPVFITVDPKRDTPEVINDFLSNFDARFVGLTGSEEQIKEIEGAYKAYAAKVPEEASKGEETHEGHDGGDAPYTMDHSAYIYLMDKNGKYSKIFSYTTSEQELAHAVEQALE